MNTEIRPNYLNSQQIKNPSISNLCVLFFPYVVRKATAHVGKNALRMCHQAQKGFHGIFIGIPQHQKGHIVYVPHRHKIISSYNVNLMIFCLVCWRTRHNHTKKLWLCDHMCHTHLMLHLKRKKLSI